jgi:hypothetical protein
MISASHWRPGIPGEEVGELEAPGESLPTAALHRYLEQSYEQTRNSEILCGISNYAMELSNSRTRRPWKCPNIYAVGFFLALLFGAVREIRSADAPAAVAGLGNYSAPPHGGADLGVSVLTDGM